MAKHEDIAASLLDLDDGSCRDINFEAPTWDGVEELIVSLAGSFKKASGTDGDGRDILGDFPASVMAAAHNNGGVYLVFDKGRSPIRCLQVFVLPEADGSPFVELKFSPVDVETSETLTDDFIRCVDDIRKQLRAKRYYVRYENASWEFGDTGRYSGVFLASDEVDDDT